METEQTIGTDRRRMFVDKIEEPRFQPRCRYCGWRGAEERDERDALDALVTHENEPAHRETVLNFLVVQAGDFPRFPFL